MYGLREGYYATTQRTVAGLMLASFKGREDRVGVCAERGVASAMLALLLAQDDLEAAAKRGGVSEPACF